MLFDYLNVFYITYLNNIIIYFNNPLKYKIYIKKILACLQKIWPLNKHKQKRVLH